MGDISNNFSTSECRCPCCGMAIKNARLIAGAQKLRDLVGGPLHVSSWYRCARHNQAVGGSPTSQHLLGRAIDIWAYNMTWRQLAALAETVPEFRDGGIGRYPRNGFIHLDVGPKRRWTL